jgi:Fic family protein
LADMATQLAIKTARLEQPLRPYTRSRVAQLVRSMNGYYSNLIEGHRTKPHEIEKALKGDFSDKKDVREKQLLHLAHMGAQETMEKLNLPQAQLVTFDTIQRIHRELYERLPLELRLVDDGDGKQREVIPGEFRTLTVSVGRHVAPHHEALSSMARRFTSFYGEKISATPARSLVAAMAAHHRLVWLHPFRDGNGRVARLFTHLWLRSVEGEGEGLWTLSRGLARNVSDYRRVLDAADEKRRTDFDGRGYLSERGLHDFCHFMLTTSLDQVDFMANLFDIGGMEKRLSSFCRIKEAEGSLPNGSHLVLKQVFLEDEIDRGDVARILNVSPRTAQPIVGKLLENGFLESPTPKGALRLAFPPKMRPFLFPDLYPAGSPQDEPNSDSKSVSLQAAPQIDTIAEQPRNGGYGD